MAPDVPCCTFYLIGCHNLSSGSTNFHRVMQFEHQVTNFAGDNLKHRVTLVPSGAGVVCHVLLNSKTYFNKKSVSGEPCNIHFCFFPLTYCFYISTICYYLLPLVILYNLFILFHSTMLSKASPYCFFRSAVSIAIQFQDGRFLRNYHIVNLN